MAESGPVSGTIGLQEGFEMNAARRCELHVARRDEAAARAWTTVLVAACFAVAAWAPVAAHADKRYGDTTWVAPAGVFDTDSTSAGPRVAPPDRERTWETAVRTPFRIVFLPVRLVARGLEAAASFVGPKVAPSESNPKPGPRVVPEVNGNVNDL